MIPYYSISLYIIFPSNVAIFGGKKFHVSKNLNRFPLLDRTPKLAYNPNAFSQGAKALRRKHIECCVWCHTVFYVIVVTFFLV